MIALFAAMADSCAAEITRRAGRDGTIARSATLDIQQAVGVIVAGFFVGRNRAGQRAPFEIGATGALSPLSPYMRALWASIGAAVRIPVTQHGAQLARQLPPDVLARLRTAQRNPFSAARRLVAEQVFRPNPLAQYDAPHTWIDPNGYTLSDRIWNTAGDTRRRLDLFLERNIAEGRGALDISRDLRVFLAPGQELRRTKAPYGTDASYSAMRLARTEISRAHAQAAVTSAAMNPFVEGMKVRLSGSHPKRDICDDAAAAGPWPKDKIPPEYSIPMHPHCLCTYQYVQAENTDQVLEELRADIQRARAELVDLIGPVLVDDFTRQLLGEQPASASPFVVQPPPPAYDLSEGMRVRMGITGRLDALDLENSAIDQEAGALSEGINKLVHDWLALEKQAESKEDKDRIYAEFKRQRDPLDHRRGILWERQSVIRKEMATVTRSALQLDPARRSTFTLAESAEFKGKKGVPKLREKSSAALDFVNSVTADSGRDIELRLTKRGRAFASGDSIHVDTNESTGVIIHEIGHVIEHSRGSAYRAKRLAFFEDRTRGDELKKLADLHPGSFYSDDEVVKLDRWVDEYMGKVYKHDGTRWPPSDPNGIELSSSELISMGVQLLYEAPRLLIAKDPEFFDFIVSYLRGAL